MRYFLLLLCFSQPFISIVNCSDDEVKPLLLFQAADEGNKDIIKWLVDHGADINIRDVMGRSALMRAVDRTDDVDMVQYLLSLGADSAVTDNEGMTALLLAAKRGNLNALTTLMNNKADYKVRDKRGRTALHIAANNSRCSVLDIFDGKYEDLLNATDHWGRTPLWYSAYNGNFKCFEILQKLGSKTDSDDLVAGINGGDMNIVSSLLKIEHNVNAKNASGFTLMQIACDKNNNKVAIYLIDKGADINVKDDEGKTLLHICSASGSENTISALISKNLDVNAKDNYGNSPAHYAAMNNKPNILSLLKEKDCDVKAKNKDKKTPVEFAIENNCIEALDWCLNNGYYLDERVDNGRTLCHEAAISGSIPAMKHLIQLKVDCNHKDLSGDLPIHYAIYNVDSLKTLLEAGVSVDAVDSKGKSPLTLALETLNSNSVNCLLKFGARQVTTTDSSTLDKDTINANRYNAYVKNSNINKKKDLNNLISQVSNGDIKPDQLQC